MSFRLFDEAASVAAGASFGASAAAAAADVEELLERVDREKKLVDGVAMLASLGIQELPLKIRMCQDRCVGTGEVTGAWCQSNRICYPFFYKPTFLGRSLWRAYFQAIQSLKCAW